jgi:hypothetical protein
VKYTYEQCVDLAIGCADEHEADRARVWLDIAREIRLHKGYESKSIETAVEKKPTAKKANGETEEEKREAAARETMRAKL